ncbi:MAG: M20 family metallopeptidase [Candidatus Omnitrophota bacterium]
MKQIYQYIDRKQKDIIEFTKKIVSIPTINPPGENYCRCVTVIEKQCRLIGLKCKRIITPKKILKKYNINLAYPRISLLAHWQLNKDKTVHFNGHYDIVPATAHWKTLPFRPEIKQGKLYGRGTEDMKATIASMLLAVEAVAKTNNRPKVNVQFSFVPDEEIGGMTGIKYLVQRNLIKADFAVGEGAAEKYFSCGNKGMLWFEVTVLGRSAHAAEPDKGINSFEKMVKVVNALFSFKNKTCKKKTRFNTEAQSDRFATMVIGGKIWGGDKINIVPDNSSFTIDRRILPEEDIYEVKDKIIKTMQDLAKDDPEIKLKIKVSAFDAPVSCPQNNKLFKIFSAAIEEVYFQKACSIILCGGTDLRFLMRKNIPAVGYSVKGMHRAHSDNEFVYIKSITDTAKVFAYVLMNLE